MMNKEPNFISVILYVHNNEHQLQTFLPLLYRVLYDNFLKSEIICVDDDSTDHSSELIKQLAQEFQDTAVSILHMSYFHGMELSMQAGVDLAIGDFVFEFDQISIDYEADLIMKVYQTALNGIDIVSASPKGHNKLTSHLYYRIFNLFTFDDYEMQTETFRILSRRAVNRVMSMNKTILYRKAVYANCGFAFKNIKYEASISRKKDLDDKKVRKFRSSLAVDSLILFTEIGYRFSIWMTLLMMLFAAGVAIYTFVIFLTGIPVEGWTTTMLFLSVAFFGLFGILTVIIKYLSILVNLSFKMQQYRIAGIEKISK